MKPFASTLMLLALLSVIKKDVLAQGSPGIPTNYSVQYTCGASLTTISGALPLYRCPGTGSKITYYSLNCSAGPVRLSTETIEVVIDEQQFPVRYSADLVLTSHPRDNKHMRLQTLLFRVDHASDDVRIAQASTQSSLLLDKGSLVDIMSLGVPEPAYFYCNFRLALSS